MATHEELRHFTETALAHKANGRHDALIMAINVIADEGLRGSGYGDAVLALQMIRRITTPDAPKPRIAS